MKRVSIAFTVVAMSLAVALPSAAKKPTPVPAEPIRYDVTMAFAGDEPGLSTVCGEEGSVSMFGSEESGTLALRDTDTPGEAPLIHIRAPGVTWERTYPEALEDVGFNECHGPSVYEGVDHPFADYGGALTITIDEAAGTVEFRWHFDYYIDAEDVGKTKPRWVSTIREHFTSETVASYNAATGLVSGSFPFSWYLKEGRTIIKRYEPMGSVDMQFYLAVAESG